jgi:hypothetical protein
MDRSFALSLLIASASLAADPDPAERYARAVKQEDEVARKTAERIAKPGDSERERWFKRLDEVFTGKVPPDPADWFDLITTGRSEWARDGSRYFAEFHERVCHRFDLKKDVAITRDTFATYAARFLGPDSPPWRIVDVGEEARGIFKQLDANRDGGLTREECSPGLIERFDSADTDKDGKVSATEYRDYLAARAGHEVQFLPPPEEKGKGDRPKEEVKGKPAPPTSEPDEPRPVMIRETKDLPKELPGWFRELDTDKDLQVGLYEWAAAKRPLAEFQAMDLNADGLLEVGEYLRYRKMQADSGVKGTGDLRAAAPGEKEKGKDKMK